MHLKKWWLVPLGGLVLMLLSHILGIASKWYWHGRESVFEGGFLNRQANCSQDQTHKLSQRVESEEQLVFWVPSKNRWMSGSIVRRIDNNQPHQFLKLTARLFCEFYTKIPWTNPVQKAKTQRSRLPGIQTKPGWWSTAVGTWLSTKDGGLFGGGGRGEEDPVGLMAVAGGKSYIMMSYVDLFSEMHFRSHIYIW